MQEQPPSFSPGSKARLTAHDLGRFAGPSLFDRLGRAVCSAGCLPRKELYEAWEMARRTRRRLRGGRIVDLGAGHGLLAHVMLLIDDTSPGALVADTALASSSATLHDVLAAEWPRLAGRVEFATRQMQDVEIRPDDVVVSSHACGRLTDVVLEAAARARARVAVLPCCHDVRHCDDGGVSGWVDGPLAIDLTRAARLRACGYDVWTQTIPREITPKNRLLMGAPARTSKPRV